MIPARPCRLQIGATPGSPWVIYCCRPPRLISVQRSAAFVIVTTTTSPLASASHCTEKGRDVPHAHAWLFLLKSFSLGSMSASIVEEKAQ